MFQLSGAYWLLLQPASEPLLTLPVSTEDMDHTCCLSTGHNVLPI